MKNKQESNLERIKGMSTKDQKRAVKTKINKKNGIHCCYHNSHNNHLKRRSNTKIQTNTKKHTHISVQAHPNKNIILWILSTIKKAHNKIKKKIYFNQL